ncbi:MAG: M61 family metallopeptidase [Pyrinomonadaceae bacterium]
MPYLRLPIFAPAVFVALFIAANTGTFAQANRTMQTNRTMTTNNAAAPDISYAVSMPRPSTHLLEVEMRVAYGNSAGLPNETDLLMPVWTPGSYLIREYERHVQDFAAADNSGRALQWNKLNKNTWRIQTNGAREWRATYRVYANELTVRTNELNDRHAFWNNAALLMYPNGFLNAPSTLRVVPPQGWQIATGLPAVADQPNTFRAENFDVLYDSPFEVGTFQTLRFEARGIPHRIVIDGEGNFDAERMRADVKKIVETAADLMGDLPYRDYTFLLHLRSTGGGGLEHLNSTALIFRRFGFRPETGYHSFLHLVAHEYFHLWNVKRIRPDALGPFDYTSENYTKLLWVAEGLTSYYENILPRRAGLISDKEFLKDFATDIQNLQNVPGRNAMSVEEASFDAWIKFYRPDENSVNSQISYYAKGAILGLLLDLQIRKLSGGAHSLDDVMRYLYNDFFKKNRNYTPADFQRASELQAGRSLDDFFRRYVRGREELDYNDALAGVGLRLVAASKTAPGDNAVSAPREDAYLGANLNQDGDRLLIRNVLAGTPAYDQGLNAADQIVAIDGARVNLEAFNARLADKRPGDTVRVTVFRADDLRTFDIKLGGRANVEYRIVAIENPTAEQSRNYQSWLGAPLMK